MSNEKTLDACLERLRSDQTLKTLYAVCIEEKCKRDLREGRASFRNGSNNCEHCALRGDQILSLSAMLVRVKSVAYAVGFCPYAARLIELFGVQRVPLSTIPGKGSLVHRILARVAPKVFQEVLESRRCTNIEDATRYAREVVESAREELYLDNDLALDSLSDECRNIIVKLQGEGVERLDKYEESILLGSCCRDLAEALGVETIPASRDECIKLALHAYEKLAQRELVEQSLKSSAEILANAVRYFCHYARLARWEVILPLAEYTLLDYNFRLIGVPDLILVEPERREAIVFEWKSLPFRESSPSVQSWEKIQTLLYAVLTANLLGYDTFDVNTLSDVLTSKIIPVLCHTRKCIVVTRGPDDSPSMRAFAISGFYTRGLKLLDAKSVRGVLALARLASEYLTMLAIASQTDNECQLSYSKGEGSIVATVYRLMPEELRDNSLRKELGLTSVPYTPAKENSRLCVGFCKNVLKLFEACRLYMRELHRLAEKDESVRRVRNKFFGTMEKLIARHEEVYAPLAALYYTRSKSLVDLLRRLGGRSPLTILYNVGQKQSTLRCMPSEDADKTPNMILISKNSKHHKSYRFQVFKRIVLADTGSYGLAKLEYALLPTIWRERMSSEEKLHLAMPRQDKSIYVAFISPLHIRLNTPLAAGLSVFMRSTEVGYSDMPMNAYMQLVTPSPSLHFSFQIFAENLDRLAHYNSGDVKVVREGDVISYECKDNCFFLVFESDVDLTYLSRSVLDKMLRLYLLLRTTNQEIDELVENVGNKLSVLLSMVLSA